MSRETALHHKGCDCFICKPGAVLHGDEVREALKEADLEGGWVLETLTAEVRRLQSELDRLRGCEALLREARGALDSAILYMTVTEDSLRKMQHGAALTHLRATLAAIDAATEARTLRTGSGSRSDEQDERKECGEGRTSG